MDIWLAIIPISLVVGMLFADWTAETNDSVLGLVLLALAVPIHALLLSTWGTTAGKSMLGITVRKDGRKLTFGEAIQRELGVYIVGMGLGLPLVSLITQIAAYNHLQKKKQSSWDEDRGTTVTHSEPKMGGIIGTVLILLVFGGFFILGTIADQGY